MIVRPRISDGGMVRELNPGDLLGGGEPMGGGANISTNGNASITGAQMAQGIMTRTVVGANTTDSFATATQLITAIAGNSNGGTPDVVPGTTFRLLFINGVAYSVTLGTGVEGVTLAGTTTIAASLWREYLVQITNSTPRVSLQATNLTASKVITFSDPQPMGTVTPGMWMSGTNITSGTKVVGLTLNGSGKISGVVTDTDSTGANATSVALVFSPAYTVQGLRSGTA